MQTGWTFGPLWWVSLQRGNALGFSPPWQHHACGLPLLESCSLPWLLIWSTWASLFPRERLDLKKKWNYMHVTQAKKKNITFRKLDCFHDVHVSEELEYVHCSCSDITRYVQANVWGQRGHNASWKEECMNFFFIRGAWVREHSLLDAGLDLTGPVATLFLAASFYSDTATWALHSV